MNGPVGVDETWSRERNGRSLRVIASEIREELKSFFQTRVEMVRSELDETLAVARFAVPMILLSLGLVAVGFLLFSVAVAVLIAGAFGGPYAWFLGFIIVAVLWTVFGVVAALFAYNALRRKFPKRTLEVLKADKLWLQSTVRSNT